MKFKLLSLLAIICLCAIFCTSCGPPVTDIVVDCNTSELIDAINTANNSPMTTTTIHLSANCVYELSEIETYDTSEHPAAVGLPEIISPIIIDGQSATIKRAHTGNTPAFRLLWLSTDGDVTITELTLEGGNVLDDSGLGGAVLNYGKLIINNSTIANNSADRGGGIYNKGTFETSGSVYHQNDAESAGGAIENKGSMVIENSNFYSNQSSRFGGAIANYGAEAQITGCEFDSNITPTEDTNSMGGAIYNSSFGLNGMDSSNIEISACIFYHNQAHIGGAIANRENSEIHINDSSISNNQAIFGGGIYNQHYASLLNSTFSSNQATKDGGAIFSAAPYETYGTNMYNCTISGNTLLNESQYRGAGISVFGRTQLHYVTITENTGGTGLFIGSKAAVSENSIIANNPLGDCSLFDTGNKLITSSQANLDSDNTCPNFILWADPMLEPLTNNGGGTLTHKPQDGSPAIDAATDPSISEDQIHQSRPIGPANDLGAFEVQAELIIVPTLAAKPQITPEYVEEPAQKPEFGWDWLFEGFVCSDMGLTEFYMKTSAPAEEFHLLINEKNVACYQQTYDTERYWCHVEKQPLGWDLPAELTFCVGEECTTIDRTTLSENRCTAPDASSQPVTDACSTFTDQRNCIAAPNCSWNCTRTALGETCSCEGN